MAFISNKSSSNNVHKESCLLMCSQFTLAKLAGAAAARQPASCQTYNSPPSSFDVVSDKEIPNGFPQIIQNPGMKVVEKGRNTVLVCEAGGDPNPTITWIKVGWRFRMGGGPYFRTMDIPP